MIIKWTILILIQLASTMLIIRGVFALPDDYKLTKDRANDENYLKQNKNWKLQEYSEFYFAVIFMNIIFIALIVVPIFYYGWANTI